MRTLSKSERMNLIDAVEKICRSKKPDKNMNNPKQFINDIYSKYPAYKKSLNKCLTNYRDLIGEMTTLVSAGTSITTKKEAEWFKSLLGTVVKSLRLGLFLASEIIRKFYNVVTASVPDNIMAAIISFILVGLPAAVVIIGLGMWRVLVEEAIEELIKAKPVIVSTIKKWFGYGKAPIPDELVPPEPQAPNISVTTLTESINLNENAMVGGILFVIFLKAAIAHRLNEEMKEKISILSSLLQPSSAYMSFLAILLYIGANGAGAL